MILPFHATMVIQAKYLTGDKEGMEEFISRFDVSQIDGVFAAQCLYPAAEESFCLSLMGLTGLSV